MIPLLAASLLLRVQGGGATLPKPTPLTVPDEVRDWAGFKFLPAGGRSFPAVFPVAADWSGVKGEPAANAVVWRTKVVAWDRVDRVHERGPDVVWPGHHSITPPTMERIKRALPQFRALVADATGGAVNMTFDLAEEPQALTIDHDLPIKVEVYLAPRINGGHYDAEDGVFRGPYPSAFVVHPVGGEPSPLLEVQGTPVSIVGLPDVEGQEADGVLATAMFARWREQVSARAQAAGLRSPLTDLAGWKEWAVVAQGADAPTEARLRLLSLAPNASAVPIGPPVSRAARGTDTAVKIEKDPQRGSVLTVLEGGLYRAGGLALPQVAGSAIDPAKTPTLGFWMRSDAKDLVTVRLIGLDAKESAVRIGTDVPFAYDGAWHPVRIDLRSSGPISSVVIGPDASARARVRDTLGPVAASFADFETTAEASDPRPIAEAPSATATDPEARARWAVGAGPGEARRALLKDPIEAVRANATAAALARPDPADEPALIENSLYTFEPTIYTPALRALANAKTPTADAAVKQALRIAAADRARGLAAEILAVPGDPKVVPLFIGLNQARTREARVEAIRALGRLPGSEAALMRMAYLAQDDAEVKLAATRTADPNDDYQARKLLWSAVNEPSDLVRLESLRRLSTSTIPEFQAEGLKGVHDDSVEVRVDLLEAWAAMPLPATVPAIRTAMADRSPRVRAAALRALSASNASLEAKDVPFDDPDPRVQLAATELAKAKGLTIPAIVRERYRSSPDPRVRSAVSGT